MKHLYIFIALSLSTLFSFGQTHDPYVEGIIDEVNLDSLIYQLRNLSGENQVIIGGFSTTIEHRVANWGNELATQYIKESLESYGLETSLHEYSADDVNVIAIQPGTMYPDEYYMLCAHYDAMDYYCADDNASGTAAVLEAARIFSKLDFEYSIIYALWDEEELGLIGSGAWAAEAATNGDIIHSVINMDMISWDGDDDMVAEIHTSYDANSIELSDYLVEINSLYGIGLNTVVELPGTIYSDQSSFWDNGYSSVLIIEEYYGGDFNPYYHTEMDRIDILQMPYFHEMSKLSIGSLASLAAPDINVNTDELDNLEALNASIYPNPATDQTQITCNFAHSNYGEFTLLNHLGQQISTLYKGEIPSGELQVSIPVQNLSSGLYFVKIETNSEQITQKLLVR